MSKFLLTLAMVISLAPAKAEVMLGSAMDQVIREMGEPQGKMSLGKQTVLVYPEGTITLENQRVVEIGITAQSKARVEEERKKAAYIAAQKAKGLVEYEGLWLTPTDKTRLVNDRLEKDYPAGKVSTHACSYSGGAPFPNILKEAQPRPGPYHYAVYLPHDYYEDTTRRYPCMFVASPLGNADMKNMEVGMVMERWIVVMLDESRNEAGWLVMAGNFVAAHDDVTNKLRVADGMKFATGLSGGARACTLFASLKTGFAGIILQCGGFWYTPEAGNQTYCMQHNPGLLVAALFGTTDPNSREIPFIEKHVPADRRFIESFEGGHVWAPPESMYRALDWMERKLFEETPPSRRSPDGERWYKENQRAQQEALKSTNPSP